MLPWWIDHHKKLFDHGIMINYASTDNSVEICKQMCPPHWKIVDSINGNVFDPYTNDLEVKAYENMVDGFKITLTVGEFLFTPCPLNDINKFMIDNDLNYIKTWGVCMVDIDPHILPTYDRPLIEQKHHGMISGYETPLSFILTQGHSWYTDTFRYWYSRYYHNEPFGKYSGGRHFVHSDENVFNSGDIFTLKYKYSPWNTNALERMKAYEIRKNEFDSASYKNSEVEHELMYSHLLSTAVDLNENQYFLQNYKYNMSLT